MPGVFCPASFSQFAVCSSASPTHRAIDPEKHVLLCLSKTERRVSDLTNQTNLQPTYQLAFAQAPIDFDEDKAALGIVDHLTLRSILKTGRNMRVDKDLQSKLK
jgi:hypothetical protein